MRTGHAAAIALAAWYLMAPPVRWPKNDYPYLDEHAEYHDWKVLYDSKTEDECVTARRAARRSTRRGGVIIFPADSLRAPIDKTNPKPWLEQQDEAECIASDDPRLRVK